MQWKSDPKRDEFITFSFGHTRSGKFLSWRGGETRRMRACSQDYILIQTTPASIIIVVCDGVSSSLKGDQAAQIVAATLVKALSQMPDGIDTGEMLAMYLQPLLANSATIARSHLARQTIKTNIKSALVNEVLAEVGATQGSETVFFAARIDTPLPTELRREEQQPAQVWCAWMGNVCALLLTEERDPFEMGSREDDIARWSSVRGVHGSLVTALMQNVHLQRLLIATDGAPLPDQIKDLTDDELRRLGQTAHDDVTIVDLTWES